MVCCRALISSHAIFKTERKLEVLTFAQKWHCQVHDLSADLCLTASNHKPAESKNEISKLGKCHQKKRKTIVQMSKT